MNFEFSSEQQMLRDQASSFLVARDAVGRARKVLETGKSSDLELWQEIADMGWTGTVLPEAYNGLDLSYLELCVISEEIGRKLAPIPFSSSIYLFAERIGRITARNRMVAKYG